jgi:dihydrofolate reductase
LLPPVTPRRLSAGSSIYRVRQNSAGHPKADWTNSTIISGNATQAVARLKQQPGQDIVIMGSASLVQSLMQADLIDQYRFLVQPIIVGSGKRFFKDGMQSPSLKLVSSQTFDLGVVLLTYEPERSVAR